jgi:hypothetical protein
MDENINYENFYKDNIEEAEFVDFILELIIQSRY